MFQSMFSMFEKKILYSIMKFMKIIISGDNREIYNYQEMDLIESEKQQMILATNENKKYLLFVYQIHYHA